MDVVYIILFCISVCFLIEPFLHRSSAKNQPPGPTALPIIGSLHKLGSKPHESLSDLAKLHGPLMTLRLGSVTTVVASSAEAAKEILHKHDQTLSERTVPEVVTAQPNHTNTLAWVAGDRRWRNRRRICNTQLFSTHKLDALQHLRHEKVLQLISHIRKLGISGAPVNIGEVSFATTLNLISNTIFSIDIVDSEFERAQEFKDLVWRIMEDAGRLNVSDYFPIVRRFDLQGIKKHIRPSYERLHEIFDEMIEKRVKYRAAASSSGGDGDFLDVLIDQCEEEGSDFNLQTIKPLLLDLFIAGSDTSAITTEWAMAELVRNPDSMQKVRNELIKNIGTKRSMQESDIALLPYLQAIVKETLRLHPAVPLLLPYKATIDVEVFGFTITKDSQVLVNAWAISRDPNYWEDPLSFRPERFLGSNVDFRGRDFEYIPFGAGRRICPGLPLATRMVHLMLGSMIHSFDWKLPQGITPTNINMEEKFGVTLKKALPLLVFPVI